MKFFSHGILGMNARNLRYIRTKNSDESISLADSKLKTKHFLSSRGIPFAETYFTIPNQQELHKFSLKNIKSNAFVIKPNKWSWWKGILIVKRESEAYFISWESWTEEEIKLHMIDILHGSFSLHGSTDTIVIEELLSPWKDFSLYCKYGLADIRVIVYNLVPITAMVRMPTIHSSGKANLAQWWIWIGLNIASGEVISFFQSKKIYTTSFPTEYEWIKNQHIPFWDDILLYSSQIQLHTKLGYLALDWVITKNWPKLLEINARAGLEIQNVNLVPLAARLKQVETLKVLSPEKWVEIAKTLFHTEIITDTLGKKILYLEQKWHIWDREILLYSDVKREKTSISRNLLDNEVNSDIHVITDTQVSVHIREYDVLDEEKYSIYLWKDILKDYLISPTVHLVQTEFSSHSKWTKELLEYDDEVYRASKKVNLSSLLKPNNYFVALDEFIRSPWDYNPVFEYHFPSDEKILALKEDLKHLFERGYSMKQKGSSIAELYIEKLTEIENKIFLVEAYKSENFEKITRYNEFLFWKTDQNLLSLAKEKVLQTQNVSWWEWSVLGRVLELDQVASAIHRYFENHNIPKIPITIESGNLSRMSVSYGKNVKIHISRNAVIRDKEIDAILSHEIGTHFRRYLNGKETELKLFQFWTGYYLSDEEWFAIYRSFKHLPEGYEKNAMYLKYYLLAVADTLSFNEAVNLIRSLYPEKASESIFSDAVRLKRGITHAWERWIHGTTYQKDKIYLDGYMRVKKWIDEGGDHEKLFYGKIKIQDLKIIDLL
jgi:alpha-L-glutamate ligase-like protein